MSKKNIFDPNNIDFVIYHAECTDGFGAAWAAWKLLGSSAEYYAAKHDTPPPDIAGKNVVILDFSYNNKTMKKMMKSAKSLFVIDHHKTAMIDLHDLACVHFDMNHSGAMLSWMFFHPGKEPPRMIKFIEDRDLWKWEIPYSKEFSAAFDMVPYDFDEFSRFEDESVVDDAVRRGSYILAYSKTVVSKIVKHAAQRTLDGRAALVVNSSHWMSEIGNVLSQKCDIAVIWFFDHNDLTTKVSLRSHHNAADVSEIAKKFGGGGHKNAAGFRLDLGVNIESIFDDEKSDK